MSNKRPISLLEKWLEDVPNCNQSSVKKERKDFNDIFSSPSSSSSSLNLFLGAPSSSSTSSTFPFVTNQSSSTSLLFGPNSTQFPGSSSLGNSILNSNNNKINPVDSSNKFSKPPLKEEKLEENAVDSSSVKGIFGWEQVNDVPLPVLLRENERLIPVKIVESKIIGKFSTTLPWSVFSCINIRSYYMTDAESKLLNTINSIHCDYYYGIDLFSVKDVVVCLSDVKKLYKFLETSKNVFTYGLEESGIEWLGFVNISGSQVVPYIAHKKSNSTSSSKSEQISYKYVPQSCVQNNVLLVKVAKIEMSEWDASYLRMLTIYAGLEHLQILSNDMLCLLSDLKWDSSLCPLHIEECSPPSSKLSNKLNVSKLDFHSNYSSSVPNAHQHHYQQHLCAPSSTTTSSNINEQNWLSSTNNNSSTHHDHALRSLHQISRIDLCGVSFRAINVKPYSTQQAIFVSDVVAKIFRGLSVSVLNAHYILEKILQVKLYECTRLHEDAFTRAGVRPVSGDKLVLVEVLRKCLPQLKHIVYAGIAGGLNTLNLISHP